jgi:DNA-binding NarL/FixJ family response regulator
MLQVFSSTVFVKTSGMNRTPQAPSRVLLVDPWASILEMPQMALQRQKRWHVVGSASTGDEGLRLFEETRPDLVITALTLSGLDGPHFITEIRRKRPKARVVIYSASGCRRLLKAGFESAPQGFVHKSESLTELRRAASLVADGGEYFSPKAQSLRRQTQSTAPTAGNLTPRETAVLKLIAESVNTKQIAAQLSISPKTVENYRVQFAKKLGLRDVAALTRFAVQTGLISLKSNLTVNSVSAETG